MKSSDLKVFDPLVAEWFRQRFGRPTDIQSLSWSAIVRGDHVLMTAPTGSGKTMAAFLWAIHALVAESWSTGCTRVLYISPLKALNTDIQRNLLAPLGELQALFAEKGRQFPNIQVLTRSGDTPQSDRRRMIRRPPEILITTPESLNLLLSSHSGRSILGRLKTVILDEVHAILTSRRGTYLMTAVERLVRLSGEFQRIALSATISPMARCAEFVGGYTLAGSRSHPNYIRRPVKRVTDPSAKSYDVIVIRPQVPESPRAPDTFWAAYAQRIRDHVLANRSTLIFTNSRRLSEKLTYLINNEANGEDTALLAYSHHGSLAREIRTEVEKNLKGGQLKAIVATGSLELGIDIGELDEVILVQSPWSVAEAIQRIGRAGHGVGQISRGTFLPSHTIDTISAMVIAQAIQQSDIESVDFPRAPLDVLTQVLLSMVVFESWHPGDLFNFIRCAAAYHRLSRRRFDLVLDLLQGRYQQSRIRDLQPKISYDRMEQSLSARKGAVLTLYASGGVIPDRGYYSLRHDQSGAKIGELDEEFVWEARVGQTFTLGAQNWRIRRITPSDVRVTPSAKGKPTPPFWRAEEYHRGFHLSQKICDFLELADARLTDPHWATELTENYGIDPAGATVLIKALTDQRAHTGCALPHRHHLVIEDTTMGAGKSAGRQLIWHTLWGGAINRPLAVALESAWEERIGSPIQFFSGNDAIACLLPDDLSVDDILHLVTAETVEALLHRRLAQTGFFGARFRECAARALLLPRGRINQRMPLWLTRLRAQKLLGAVAGYPDFPVILETWRTCLQDEFDLPNLQLLLREVESGAISYSHARTPFPSPLARNSGWQQVNVHMYQSDQPTPGSGGRPTDDLLYEVTLTPGLRPQVDPELVRGFEEKRQRLAPGYPPDRARELLEWIKERVALPMEEWRALLQAVQRDHGLSAETLLEPLQDKLVHITTGGDGNPGLIVARESLPQVLTCFFDGVASPPQCTTLGGSRVNIKQHRTKHSEGGISDGEIDTDQALLSQWLSFYGPRSPGAIVVMTGMPAARLSLLAEALAESNTLICGCLVARGPGDDLCDRENFEILLRLIRSDTKSSFETRTIEELPLFVAFHQGIASNANNDENHLAQRLNQLLCWYAPAALWETEFLPARTQESYAPQWMDAHLPASGLRWIGGPGTKTAFCFEDELDLLNGSAANKGLRTPRDQTTDQTADQSDGASTVIDLLVHTHARYPFSALQQMTGMAASALHHDLWHAVWKGRLSNDAYAALRRGIETDFKPPATTVALPRHLSTRPWGRRPGRHRSRGQATVQPDIGNWFRIVYPDPGEDLLDKEELIKERVRMVLDRYGIIFRELLSRELPLFRWAALFRSLRLMELAGEVVTGYFFSGIPGLQFMVPQGLTRLGQPLPEDAVFWINAMDPASLCGRGIEALKGQLPRRLPGVHMVYHGTKVVLVSHQNAKRLDIRVAADHPRFPEYCSFLGHLLSRTVMPLRSITIETINGIAAPRQNAYLTVFERLFDTSADFKSIVLFRRH